MGVVQPHVAVDTSCQINTVVLYSRVKLPTIIMTIIL